MPFCKKQHHFCCLWTLTGKHVRIHCPFLGGPHWPHMEVPRLGVQSPQPTPQPTAWDPSCVCDLHHSSQQCQILNPLSKAGDQTCNLIVSSQICFHCTTTGTPRMPLFLWLSDIPLSVIPHLFHPFCLLMGSKNIFYICEEMEEKLVRE